MSVLEQADKEWIDARYVKKDDCNDNMSKVDAKFANDDTRIKLFQQQMAMWNKLFWVIATATAGQLVASIIGLLEV